MAFATQAFPQSGSNNPEQEQFASPRTVPERREIDRRHYEAERFYNASRPEGAQILKGAISGAAAGLIAGWAMVKFQEAWAKVSEGRTGTKNLQHNVPEHRTQPGSGQSQNDQGKSSRREDQNDEPDDATIRTAELISEKIFDHKLTRDEKKVAGPVVHYAFAVGTGALYGAAAEISGKATTAFGTAFGAALFVVADEIAVPAMGLSPNIHEAPLSKHALGFFSHLVYGATTEALRRPIRSRLD